MRTEAILEKFGATEATWRDAAERNREAKQFGFIHSETPCFVGRAVAALAADSRVARKSGGIFTSFALADEYGFDDIDGRRPNMWATSTRRCPTRRAGSRSHTTGRLAAATTARATIGGTQTRSVRNEDAVFTACTVITAVLMR